MALTCGINFANILAHVIASICFCVNFGYMKFYHREEDKWYDENIRDIFKKISKNKNVNPTDYYIMTNHLTRNILDTFGNLVIKIGNKKAKKIIFNVKRDGVSNKNIYYEIHSFDNDGKYFSFMLYLTLFIFMQSLHINSFGVHFLL